MQCGDLPNNNEELSNKVSESSLIPFETFSDFESLFSKFLSICVTVNEVDTEIQNNLTL